jgi:hypothetical protein
VTRYVGVQLCDDDELPEAEKARPPAEREIWKDHLGLLLIEEDGKWYAAAHHVSSNTSYAKHDIERHYKERDAAQTLRGALDTYEWIGVRLVNSEMGDYPPGPKPSPVIEDEAADGEFGC